MLVLHLTFAMLSVGLQITRLIHYRTLEHTKMLRIGTYFLAIATAVSGIQLLSQDMSLFRLCSSAGVYVMILVVTEVKLQSLRKASGSNSESLKGK